MLRNKLDDMISCKEASMMSLKKREQPLSRADRFQLGLHLLFCRFCRAFERQTTWIEQTAKKLVSLEQLSDQEKTEMKLKLFTRENPK